MGDADERGIIERLGLPPTKRTATADQVQSTEEYASRLALQLRTEGREHAQAIERLNTIATEYPGLAPQQVAELRPELAAELDEALRWEETRQSMEVDLADLAGWLEKPAIDLGREAD